MARSKKVNLRAEYNKRRKVDQATRRAKTRKDKANELQAKRKRLQRQKKAMQMRPGKVDNNLQPINVPSSIPDPTKETPCGELIHVVTCCDENYLKLVPAVLKSMYVNNSFNNIVFHLLYYGTNVRLKPIKTLFDDFPNIELRVYNKDLRGVKYNNHLPHVSSATMLRLYIADELNDVKGKVIYLDLDIIVSMNLRQFLDLDVPKTGIAAKSSLRKNMLKCWTAAVNSKAKYAHPHSFNAGILVMDLDLLRKNDFTNKVMSLWKKYPECNDQIILNLYCDGEYAELPKNFNVFNHQDDHILSQYDDFILHFVGRKPWDKGKCSNRKLWQLYDRPRIRSLWSNKRK